MNINAGGKTRLSGAVHGLFLLVVLLGAGQLAAFIPLPVLAGILIPIGFAIIDKKGLKHLLHVPRADAVVLVTVFAITTLGSLIQAERDLAEQIAQTSAGQFPFAVVLGCVDSRVPPELIFDLGLGDVFSVRIAGNFVNKDILGSMEFACKVVGSKHILVLGHTSCGAIQGAYDNVELGHLTGLVGKLKPAVEAVKEPSAAQDDVDIDQIAEMNVRMAIEQIKQESRSKRDVGQWGDWHFRGHVRRNNWPSLLPVSGKDDADVVLTVYILKCPPRRAGIGPGPLSLPL